MAGGVIYLDSDDEITSAAARIRAVPGRRVAVVLPYGSRVATSRINFRLLARDALTHEKRLAIVAGDAATRALAASAGLPIFATVAEYESSLGTEGAIADVPLEQSETVVRPPDPTEGTGRTAATARTTAMTAGAAGAAAAAGPTSAAAGVSGTTRAGRPPDPTSDAEAARTGAPRARSVRATSGAGPESAGAATAGTVAGSGTGSAGRAPTAGPTVSVGGRGGRRGVGRTPLLIGVLVLGLAVVVGGVAAYLFLPSASAVVTPREETIGPISLRITASTAIDTPDIEAGQVPATIVSVPVEASDTFEATGKRVAETKAKGEVQFQNFDPTASNTIAKGAIVSTRSGVRFRTNAAVTVPAAELVGVTIFPAAKSVKVTAVDPGPDGNVGANTIVEVPRNENGVFLRVTNPQPTDGGTREEFPRITQEDVDGAMAQLGAQLQAAFTDQLADPSLVPEDVTIFPETASLGEATPSVALDELVGQEVESFDLALTATGTVTSVDAAPVRSIAEARLDASIAPGYQLVEGSSEITESPAVVEGSSITYPVVATARQIAVLDPAALKAAILGKPVAEARDILEAYGETRLDVWPDWVGTIPTFESRVDVTVNGPVASEDDGASASPGPSDGSDASAEP